MTEILRNNYTKLHNYTGPQRGKNKPTKRIKTLVSQHQEILPGMRGHCVHTCAWYDCAWPVWRVGGTILNSQPLATFNCFKLYTLYCSAHCGVLHAVWYVVAHCGWAEWTTEAVLCVQSVLSSPLWCPACSASCVVHGCMLWLSHVCPHTSAGPPSPALPTVPQTRTLSAYPIWLVSCTEILQTFVAA